MSPRMIALIVGLVLLLLIGFAIWTSKSTERVEVRQEARTERSLNRQQQRTCRQAIRKNTRRFFPRNVPIPAYCYEK